MILLLLACLGSDNPVIEVESETPEQNAPQRSSHSVSIVQNEEGDMVQIPEAMVELGPRKLAAVEGYQMPQTSQGMTPNLGKGIDQRAPGGPPLPPNGNAPQHPNIPHQKGAKNVGPSHPQHKPQFALDQKGVGHVRPGSGVPSAPPNMPGSQAKFVGEEETWTANPSNQMKSKMVTVSSFWIDISEVTRKEYKKFLDATGYRPPFVSEEWATDGWNWTGTNYLEGTGDHPVVMVSWYDAQEYCLWKNKRLPTEAEWQLAALGPAEQGFAYPWGKKYRHDVHNHGQIESPNFDDSDGYLTTSPAGAFPEGNTPYGVEDIFGNAWEFTADARRATWTFYANANGTNLRDTYAPTPSLYVAVRGGSYFFDLRPFPGGERNEFLTEVRRKTAGFRCAK